MNTALKLTIATLLVISPAFVGFRLLGVAQTSPPPAQTPATLAPAQQPKAISSANFVSLEGRFSVSLPERAHGVQRLSLPTPFGTARGDAYTWTMKEALFVIGHADAVLPVDTPDAAKQVFDSLRESVKKLALANSGSVGAEKRIELNKHPGIEQRVDLFTGFVVQRTYLVSRRLYQTLMFVRTTQREYQSDATKILDSFRLLTESEISAGLAQEAAKAEPKPLPQQPVAERMGTDASDNGLRDRVRTVLEESQDLTGTWSVQTKKRDSFENYNELGNLTRRESYDYKGNLSDITVYGYIDGSRVSYFKTITREYDPPPMFVGSSEAVKKSDPRYQYRFEFKYDEKKRLIENTWFHNTGERYLRYVYNYSANQLETLVYSANGSINQRSTSQLDSKGNETERTAFDPRDGSMGSKYSYAYEFDEHGNWIKRTTSKVVTTDGRSELTPQYVDFRTITYY